MQQWAETQGTQLSGPVAVCCSQNLLAAVVGSHPSPLWQWKASPYEELCSLWYNEEVKVKKWQSCGKDFCFFQHLNHPPNLSGVRQHDPCTADWCFAGQSCWFRGASFVLRLLERIEVGEWLFLLLAIVSVCFLSKDRLRCTLKANLCWEWGGETYRTGGPMRVQRWAKHK